MKKQMLRFSMICGIVLLVLSACHKKNDFTPDSTSGTFTDTRDTKTYGWRSVSGQMWMTENLNYEGILSSGTSSCYGNNEDSCRKYGRLYSADAASLVCPAGWSLPSDADWRLLEHNLGMSNKDTGQIGSQNTRGVPQAVAMKLLKGGSSGFNALLPPITGITQYWTSSSSSTYPGTNRIFRQLMLNDSSVYRNYSASLSPQFCVRCIKK